MTLREFYVLLQIIGIVIMLFELGYVISQKPSKLQRDLILGLTFLIFAFLAYIIELEAPNVEVAMIGCMLGYVGKPFALISVLYLLIDYSHIKIPRWITFAVVFYFVIIAIIVFTNDIHHLYYPTYSYDPTNVGSPLDISHGIFWYIFMASSFVIFALYIGLVIYEVKYSKSEQVKRMSIWLFLMLGSSFVGLALFIFGLTNGYDSTLTGTLFGSLCLLVLFGKYRIFDSLTHAKESLIDESNDACIIFDAKLNISYFNEKAKLFAPLLSNSLNHKIENQILDGLSEYSTKELIFKDDNVYKLEIKEFTNESGNVIYGKSYSFVDISDSYYHQETLAREVKEATKTITDIQKHILLSFGILVEARDGCTGQHIKNVATSAKLIAEELAKSKKYKKYITQTYIDDLVEVIPLHDVGKIKIPDSILNKPGKLTPEEFEIMKTHAALGAEIIEETLVGVEQYLKANMAKEIAHHHHEWWNGKGYPDGLVGEDIPVSARIAAVADVYDALRMVRPYKDAYSKEKSIAIIKEESGTHFDPEVVDAFFKIVDKFDK